MQSHFAYQYINMCTHILWKFCENICKQTQMPLIFMIWVPEFIPYTKNLIYFKLSYKLCQNYWKKSTKQLLLNIHHFSPLWQTFCRVYSTFSTYFPHVSRNNEQLLCMQFLFKCTSLCYSQEYSLYLEK